MSEEPIQISGQAVAEIFDARFDGTPWMVMIELTEPLSEVAFAAAVEPEVVEASKGRPTGFEAMMIETPHGYVVRLSTTFFDDPAAPYQMRLPVNPAPSAGAPLLAKLSTQETLQIIFFDASDGSDIGRRIIRLDPDTRQGLAQIVEIASTTSSDMEHWLKAVAQAEPYL